MALSDISGDSDVPTITAIRMYQGRVSENEDGTEVDTVETTPLGGVEVTKVLEWTGGSGRHRLQFQIGNDDRRGGEVNTYTSHSAVIHIVSQMASEVTPGHPKTYPIYFWWDDLPAAQRFLTVRRRTVS